MGATNQNTIASIASKQPNSAFRVPPMPSLSAEITLFGLKEGVARYDTKVTEWTRSLEREINERLVKAQDISSGPPG